ncbi:hypothetical protein DW2_06068 [Thioclava atlantica]|uniref:Uncharacterized protein n=1 Tax=Thioclava atlantica TaxID=1317124 RepID=A0A085TXQ7_9RHOB|nr:hypothetical protein DW2_06068 [Thioclava atlantica]
MVAISFASRQGGFHSIAQKCLEDDRDMNMVAFGVDMAGRDPRDLVRRQLHQFQLRQNNLHPEFAIGEQPFG